MSENRALMNQHPLQSTSRREFLKNTGRFAAASALAGVVLPHVHAAEDNTIRLALIGCGGRGSGAVANAMSAGGLVLGDDGGTKRAALSGAGGPVKLVAMADLRQDKLDQSYAALTQTLGRSGLTCRPSAGSWASTPTARPLIACGRATWRCWPRTPPSARRTWSTRWRRASTCSWRRTSRPTRAASSACSRPAKPPRRRTSRSPPA